MKKKLLTLLITTLVLMATSVFAIEGVIGTPTPTPVGGNTATTVIGVLRWFGYAIGVGMLVIMGIKYITAAAEDKATLKDAFIKWAIGAVLVMLAPNVAGWIFNI